MGVLVGMVALATQSWFCGRWYTACEAATPINRHTTAARMFGLVMELIWPPRKDSLALGSSAGVWHLTEGSQWTSNATKPGSALRLSTGGSKEVRQGTRPKCSD